MAARQCSRNQVPADESCPTDNQQLHLFCGKLSGEKR
jgi:hypothetical protein